MNTRTNVIRQWLNTSQRKAISLGTLTALLVAVLIWGSFRPTIVAITEVVSKNNRGKEWQEMLSEKNTNLSLLIEEQQQQSDNLASLTAYFPPDSNFSLFIANLDAGAKRNNFTLDTVTFDEKRTAAADKDAVFRFTKLQPISFNLVLNGPPASIPGYLNFLSTMPYGVRIVEVSYAETRSSTVDVNLRIIVYKLRAAVTDE